MEQYQVIARKYRPQAFKEVIGQEAIVQTLKNALKSGKLAHAYLFCGSRGTGKTTLARILAKALNCQNLRADFEPCNACQSCIEITSGNSLDVMEIDGASHRGIDDIKQISDSVGYCPANGKWKIYIIDEVHMLTKEAFNALLKTLEEPPANVKFFFATTEANKIPATIVSRCQRFNLQRIALPKIAAKLQEIAQDLQVKVEESAIKRIASFSDGGLRDAESLLDQMIAFSDGNITDDVVQDVLGVMPEELFFTLDEAVNSSDIKVAFEISNSLFMQGKELSHFLEDLNAHYKAHLFTKLGCLELLTELDSKMTERRQETNQYYTQEQCLLILDYLQEAVQQLKNAISPEMCVENLLAKIVRIRLKVPIEMIAKRLIALESRLAPNHQDEPPQAALLQRQAPPSAKPAPTSHPPAAQAPVKKEAAPAKPAPVALASPVSVSAPAPMLGDEVQKNARYDTLVQFAAVELDGTVQRKKRK